jgi:tetratricopeptide (TPR) repeat protein
LDPNKQESQKIAFERALSFLRSGEAKMAEKFCHNALLDYPDDPNLLCLSARALIMLGRYDDAEERLLNAIEMFPEFTRPLVIRADMRAMQGRLEEATEDLRRAIDLGDDNPDTQLKLGRVLLMQGDQEAGKLAVDESMRLAPERKELMQAVELENAGKPEEAEVIYRKILTRDPENVEATRLLAGIATKTKQHADAEVLLERALELAPDFARALVDLVENQIEQEKVEEAIKYANRLIRIAGDNADAYMLLGAACSAAGRYMDAIDAYRISLRLSPDSPRTMSGLAHNLKTVGQQDEALEVYRKNIEKNPLFTESYWSLANLKTFRFTDEDVENMEQLLQRPDIPEDAQIHLYNALGLEQESRKNFDKAFEYFDECNVIRRTSQYYDPVETESLCDRVIEVFDQQFVSQKGADKEFSVSPIFIVGLPRSGSTLLEQILASHSLVEGTHELTDLMRVVREIPSILKINARFPKSIEEITAEGFSELGQKYLRRTSKYRSGDPFFTDKNPNNFTYVGLIHLILPHAAIIDARRHPLDSCLGSFKQLFAKGQTFSYDLSELAEYYLQYDRLMAHWNEVLPGKVLEVRYEDVVNDLDTQVRRILQHCGLPFEEQCLHFHETDRAVKTASSEQVRKPIYSSSVNLWRNYEQHLEPLIEILEPVLSELSEEDRPESLKTT